MMETITLAGIGIPVLVGITVGALKYVRLVKTGDQARWAALGSALVYSALWVAVQWYPAAAPAIGTVVTALASAILAALGHEVQEAVRAGFNEQA